MAHEKLDFTGTPDDFVEMVRMFHKIGDCINLQTGQPATRDEVAATFMQFMNVDLGGYQDYKTLELCSNGSDFLERMIEALEKLKKEPMDDEIEETNIHKQKEDEETGNSTDT